MSYFNRSKRRLDDVVGLATVVAQANIAAAAAVAAANVTSTAVAQANAVVTNVINTAVASVTSTLTTDGFAGYDVFLLFGQSNMVGYATGESLNALLDYSSPRIEQWGQSAAGNTNEVACLAADPLQHPLQGPGNSLGMAFARLYEYALQPGRKLLLVPCAWGGTGFSGPNTAVTTIGGVGVTQNFLANTAGNLTDLAIQRTNRAMAYHPVLNPRPAYAGSQPPAPSPYNAFKGVLWHQGENDVASGFTEAQYKKCLQDLLIDLRTKVQGGSNATVFIVGQMTPDWYIPRVGAGVFNVLAQVGNVAYFGLPNCAYVSSMLPFAVGTNPAGNIHFSFQGYRDMGARYYQQYVQLAGGAAASISNATALAANAYTDGLTLTWSVSPGTVLTYANVGNFAYTLIGGTSLTVPYTSLQASTQYAVTLTPRSKGGALGNTVSLSAVTGPAPGLALSNLAAATGPVLASGISVSWVAGPNVTSVALQYGLGSSPGSYASYGTVTGTSAVMSNVFAANTQYTIRAIPTGNAGQGAAVAVGVTTPQLMVANAAKVYLKVTSATVPAADLLGNPLTAFGAANLSVALDPTRGYVIGMNNGWFNTDVPIGNSFTKAAWVCANVNPQSVNMNIVSSTHIPPGNHYLWVPGGTLTSGQALVSTPATVADPAGNTFPSNTWVHVAYTYDQAANAAVLYKNGVAVASNSAVAAWNSGGTGQVCIGSYGNASSVCWRGFLDDVRVYGSVLTAQQIQQMYGLLPTLAGFTATPGALLSNGVAVSWTATNVSNVALSYGLGASPGSYTSYGTVTGTSTVMSNVFAANTQYTIQAVPFSPLGQGATVTATVTTPQLMSANTALVYLKITSNTVPTADSLGNPLAAKPIPANVAVALDPVRGYVLNTNGGSFNGFFNTTVPIGNSYSKAAWVYASNNTLSTYIVSSIHGNLPAGYPGSHYLRMTGGFFNGGQAMTSGQPVSVTDTTPVPNNTWVHVAYTYDQAANVAVLYKNGVVVASNTAVAAWNSNGAGQVSIAGFANSAASWRGYMDDVRVYGSVLTAQQIQQMAGVSIPTLAGFTATPGVLLSNGVAVSWTAISVSNVALSYGLGASPGSYTSYGTVTGTSVVMSSVFAANTQYTIQAVPFGPLGQGAPVTATVTTPQLMVANTARVYLKVTSNAVPAADSLGNPLTQINANNVSVTLDPTRGYVLGVANGWLHTGVPIGNSYTKTAWVYANVNPQSYGAMNPLSSINFFPGSHYLLTSFGTLRAGQTMVGGVASSAIDPASNTFPSNTWVHIAYTYDQAAGAAVLYKNGVAVASNSAVASWNSGGTGLVSIGAYTNSSPWYGLLDDLRVYGSVLTAQQIQQMVGLPVLSGFTATPGSLLSNGVTVTWTAAGLSNVALAYGTGASPSSYAAYGTVTDTPTVLSNVFAANTQYTIQAVPFGPQGQGATVTSTFTTPQLMSANTARVYLKITSNTVPTADSLGNPLTAVSPGNLSVALDPVRGYVLGLNNGWLNTTVPLSGSYSKTAWVYGNATASSMNPLSSVNLGPGDHYLYVNSNAFKAGQSTGNSIPVSIIDPGVFTYNVWVHVAYTYDSVSNSAVLYRNGLAVASNSAVVPWTSNSGQVCIGTYANSISYWRGFLDDLRVYSSALTAQQIQQMVGS
jgi:hypothetical protein